MSGSKREKKIASPSSAFLFAHAGCIFLRPAPRDDFFDIARFCYWAYSIIIYHLYKYTLFSLTMPPFIWPILVGAASIGLIQLIAPRQVDNIVMGLVRDLGRYKAKKRRMANTKGLMLQTLLQKDDPLQDLLLLDGSDTTENTQDLPTFTLDELEEFGDGQDGRPILLALYGRVYDVSLGHKFYGPSGAYGHFAGHDVTYSLSAGCKSVECLDQPVDTLTEKQQKEGKRWLSFFHLHDKYPLVGKLEDDHWLNLLEELVLTDEQGEAKNPILHPEM